MKITSVQITDYKRIREVAITPDADRSIILIGGKNASGKSSTLDALTAAFGGKRAAATDPVRHGAKEAAIYVELDGGKLTIDRSFKPDGTSTLEVRDPDGVVKSPQAMLEKLVGARMLDPLAFLGLDAKEQRARLMKLIPDAERIQKLNDKREAGFTRRTELTRDLKKAEGELARVAVTDPGKPIDVVKLHEEARAFGEQQRAGERLAAQVETAAARAEAGSRERAAAVAQIDKLEAAIAQLRAGLVDLDAMVDLHAKEVEASRATMKEAAAKWAASAARRAHLDADIARADEHNRAVYAAQAEVTRRERAQAEVDKLRKDTAELTAGLALVEERKAAILAAAKLPVEGLAIADDGIMFNGVPFAQASGAEQLRVALGLAIAASPGLHDVWIRDGALLDEEHLDVVAKMAAAADKRVWIERVGTRDPGAILISDGKVVA